MRKGWEVKRLYELCTLKPPKGEVRKILRDSEIVSFAPMEDLGINEKYLTAVKGKPLKDVINSYTYFANNDVLLAKITPCFENGKLGIARNLKNGVGFGSSEYFVFRPLNILTSEFLYYFFSQDSFRIEGKKNMSGAVGHKRVSLDYIENLLIPLPPLSEQHRIVAILDEAFSSITKAKENAEKNLANVREAFDSTVQCLFVNHGRGWQKKCLGKIAVVKSGGTPLSYKKEYWEGNIAWYSSGELNNLFTQQPKRFINDLAIENSNAKLFPKGSLLIGMYDTAALKMSILDREGTFNQAIAGVMPNDKINLIFILHSINSIKPDLLNLRRGVRQKNLSLEKIKEIPVFLPPLIEQHSIVDKLDTLSTETKKLETIYKQKLADLDELKKSILAKAFNGELITDLV